MHKIEPLSKSHHRKTFDCGTHTALNLFLQQQARQQAEKGISRTFVLVHDNKPHDIIGYFSLILTEVKSHRLPEPFSQKYPQIIAGVKLARLAVDIAHQKQGIGTILLVEAMRKSLVIAENAGVIGLFVDAKDASAKQYYCQYGFETMQDNQLELFLPFKLVKQMVEQNPLPS